MDSLNGKRRSGFTLIELMVVVGIILFITALSLPNFIALIKSQGVAKAARMVQTAVLQTRNRAVSLGRQQRIQFLNDYPAGSNRSVILVSDGGEDWDGNGDPWTNNSPASAWENTDEKLVEVTNLPAGYVWGKGKVANVASTYFPLLIFMPDGSLRVYNDLQQTAWFAWTAYPVSQTDLFNVTASVPPSATPADSVSVRGNHELEVVRGTNGDVYYVHFIRPTGRVKIKGDS